MHETDSDGRALYDVIQISAAREHAKALKQVFAFLVAPRPVLLSRPFRTLTRSDDGFIESHVRKYCFWILPKLHQPVPGLDRVVPNSDTGWNGIKMGNTKI